MLSSTGRSTVSINTRIRVVAGLLGFALGAVYTLQIASAFSRHALLGTLFIAIACSQVMYGLAILFQPWTVDHVGNMRRDAAQHGRRWYLIGIAGNLVLMVVLGSSLAGIAGPLSATTMELLTVVLEALAVACLAALVRMPPSQTRAR